MTRGPASRACTGKQAHPDRSGAAKHARWLEKRDNLPRFTMRAYECDHCGAWHVGHATIREQLRSSGRNGLGARRNRHKR